MTPQERASRWFDRSAAALLGAVPCGRGCTQCCIGTFAITRLDAAGLADGLSRLAPDIRDGIAHRARAQASAMEEAFPSLRASAAIDGWSEADIAALVERFGAAPCPALGADGGCLVYASRPVTCRMMGIPVEEDGLVRGACAVQSAVPLIRLPDILRAEEDGVAEHEARALNAAGGDEGFDELFLPYGFLGAAKLDRAEIAVLR